MDGRLVYRINDSASWTCEKLKGIYTKNTCIS